MYSVDKKVEKVEKRAALMVVPRALTAENSESKKVELKVALTVATRVAEMAELSEVEMVVKMAALKVV